jgi:hypothetical protein
VLDIGKAELDLKEGFRYPLVDGIWLVSYGKQIKFLYSTS